MSESRAIARAMAAEAIGEGQPTAWFDRLYGAAERGELTVPWADLSVNPFLASWPVDQIPAGSRVMVIGCGFGDDAEWLAGHGFDVAAFDVSLTAVEACRRRFPSTRVRYFQADLLDLPADLVAEPFDLVVEIYTVQVLPPGSEARAQAISSIAALTGGTLLAIARGREETDDLGAMPWPLTRDEADSYLSHGLTNVTFEDFYDDEDPPVRRFRGVYSRNAPRA